MEPENVQPEKKKRGRPAKNVTAWAGLLRNFASIIASFISLATLFILLKQNERTYRPDLIFKPDQNTFRVAYREPPVSCDDIEITGTPDSTSASVYLTASNIGLGAAKALEVNWQFEPEQMDDTLIIGRLTVPTQARFDEDLNTLLFQNCFRDERLQQYAEYCLPVNAEKNPVQFSLPTTFLHAWLNILIRICHHPAASLDVRRDALLAGVQQFHTLRFTATYQDINQKTYSKPYQVQVLPVYIDLAKKEMLVTWAVSERPGRVAPPEKHTIIINSGDGGPTLVASLELPGK